MLLLIIKFEGFTIQYWVIRTLRNASNSRIFLVSNFQFLRGEALLNIDFLTFDLVKCNTGAGDLGFGLIFVVPYDIIIRVSGRRYSLQWTSGMGMV